MMTTDSRTTSTKNDSAMMSCSCFRITSATSYCKKQSYALTTRTKRGILKRNSTTEQDHEEFADDYSRKILGSNTTESLSCSSSVSFDSITIREYSVTIGDNPSCSGGVPISIDWHYGKQVTVPVEYYEKVKPPRREKNQMKIPSEARFELLQNWDCSPYRISQASEEAQRERELRNKSLKAFARRERLRRGLHGLISYPRVLFEGLCHHQQKRNVVSTSSTDYHDDSKVKSDSSLLADQCDKGVPCLKEEEQQQQEPSNQEPAIPSSSSAGDTFQIADNDHGGSDDGELYLDHKEHHQRNSRNSTSHNKNNNKERSQHDEEEKEAQEHHKQQQHQHCYWDHVKDDEEEEHKKEEQDALSYTHHDHVFLA